MIDTILENETMVYVTLFFLMYIIPVFLMFRYIRLSHYHPKGFNYGCVPGIIEIIVMFCPFVNFVLSYSGLMIGDWKAKEHRKKSIFEPNKPFK